MNLFRKEALLKHFEDNIINNKNNKKIFYNNFMKSNVFYCILGLIFKIGDRNHDNILINHDNGISFHIGLKWIFLLSHKTNFGFKRERSPFFLTWQMKYLLDKNNLYKSCVEYFFNSFMILRKYYKLFMNLCFIMISFNNYYIDEHRHRPGRFMINKI